jgi:NAD(P)-dependent dehydrogenase (short-subunit alcohol dehydrogenase family)
MPASLHGRHALVIGGSSGIDAAAGERAAARIPALGVEELAVHLDDRCRMLTGGGRRALRRWLARRLGYHPGYRWGWCGGHRPLALFGLAVGPAELDVCDI